MLQQEKKNRALLAAFLIGLLTLVGGDVFATANISTMDQLAACIADANEAECELSDSFSFDRQLTITRDVTIRGNNNTLSRADGYAGGLFKVNAENTLTISELNIDGGAQGWDRDLSKEAISFRFNATGDRAYGQYTVVLGENDKTSTASLITNDGTLKISDSSIKNNYVTTNTASAIASTGPVEIANSTVQHVGGNSVGAIHMKETAPITVTGSNFIDNSSGNDNGSSYSGAIHSIYGTVTVKDSTFKENTTTGNGGAINSYGGAFSVDNCVFENNTIGNDGSAIKLGRGSSQMNTPLEQATASITNSAFSGNMSLGYYWEDGTPSPNGTIANGNAEGTISYYNDGYDEIIVKGDTFENEKANWGVLSFYSCDAGTETEYNCVSPMYTIEDVTFEDIDTVASSSAIRVHDADTVTVKNVTLKNYNSAYGIYLSIAETINIENVTIDNSAFKDSESAMMGLVLRNASEANVNGLTYTNNNGEVYIDRIDEVNITNSTFTDNVLEAPLRLLPNSHEGEMATFNIDNITIENNTASSTTGAGLIIDNVISGDMTVNIGDGVVIRNNLANNTDKPENFGVGGGISIRSDSTTNVNISENAIIEDNTAVNGGDDLYINSRTENSVVTVKLNQALVNGSNGAITDPTVIIRGIGRLGLKSKKTQNPPTGDSIIVSVAMLSASLFVGYFIISRAGRVRP